MYTPSCNLHPGSALSDLEHESHYTMRPHRAYQMLANAHVAPRILNLVLYTLAILISTFKFVHLSEKKCYSKKHWINPKLICTHKSALFKQNTYMGMPMNKSTSLGNKFWKKRLKQLPWAKSYMQPVREPDLSGPGVCRI